MAMAGQTGAGALFERKSGTFRCTYAGPSRDGKEIYAALISLLAKAGQMFLSAMLLWLRQAIRP